MAHFFEVLSVNTMIEKLCNFAKQCSEKRENKEEKIHILDADARVLSQNIIANEDLPFTSRSAMDGYAVHAEDTFGASDSIPLLLNNTINYTIDAIPTVPLKSGECAAVVTGGIPPDGANAVVMVEHTEKLSSEIVEIRKSVAPYTHIMLQGEDVQKNHVALEKNTLLNPQKIGMLAALGISEIPVLKKVEVAILSTGDEVQSIDTQIRKGQVRDVNSYTLSSMIKRASAHTYLAGIVKDNFEELQSALKKLLEKEYDIVLLSGGSSVGSRDFTLDVFKSLEGCEIISHGLAMSPGKPVIFAKYKNTLICGLPGQVTSAQIVMMRLIIPYIQYLNHKKDAFLLSSWQQCNAILERNIASKHGREDYIRVALEKKENTLYARPILGHSGLLRTLVHSHGIIRIDSKEEGIEAQTSVPVYLF